MNEIPLKQVIDASLENLKQVISADNVIGTPITLPDKTVIIPISKVSVGFTSGGVDFDSKHNPLRQQAHFGGGNAAGLTVTPLAFLVASNSDVRLLNINDPLTPEAGNIVGTISDLVDRSPAIIERIMNIFKNFKKPESTEASDDSSEASEK
ncbi:putative spore protein YtfJ [bioreactor metagenome]|uniref:Putative spore protein YtfJ n=1 Tax=bioreactor metagenome TaxID=1076179 RepID=A0A644ZXS5_9ZZZZ|nr:GerW family sporulation protein [Oscillospiraceae bacterium]